MSRSHSHVISIRAKKIARICPRVFKFRSFPCFCPPCAALISLAMALSQHGSLPDPAANTHTYFLALLRRPHTLEEATYTGGLLVGEVVEWAKGLGVQL